MPTMGGGRHVLRLGTLRQFPIVVSDRTLGARTRVADAVQEILANSSNRPRLLAEVENLVAELYGIDAGEFRLPS